MADTAPPFDVFTAAGTETRTIGALYPAPLTGAKVTPAVSFAKKALFDAVLWANAPEAIRTVTPVTAMTRAFLLCNEETTVV
ncbi:MAG: hypothetical protein DMF96_04200, partial [Acidobacteria bacterium]